MGSPKALLEIDGTTLLARLVQALWLAPVEGVRVVVSADDAVAAEAQRVGAEVAIHRASASGRASSLQAGWRATPRDRSVLVAPVDCPLVAPSTVRALLARAGDALVVRPRHAGRGGHPMWLAASLREEALALSPDASLRELVHRDPARRLDVEVDDPAVLDNLDTPEDFERARARDSRGRGDGPS